MASRLFRAVVCFGISLGSSSAACLGAIDGDIEKNPTVRDPDAPDRAAPPPTTPTSPSPTSTTKTPDTPLADAAVDAKLDAKPDVVDAAIDAAFCDAAWPTTKGSPPLPKCLNPLGECKGAPQPCLELVGPFTCDWKPPVFATKCVEGKWTCSPGFVPSPECKCESPLPDGSVCSDAGPVPGP